MRDVMPLEDFPPDMRERIEAEASGDTPPPRYRRTELALFESRGWYEWHIRRGIDPDKRRDKIPWQLRQAVIERDGYVCQLCGNPVDPLDVHLDHKVPFSKGGRTTIGNLQVAHSTCNLRKGARYAPS